MSGACRYKKIHNTEKQSCTFCNKTFSRVDNLKRHVYEIHEIDNIQQTNIEPKYHSNVYENMKLVPVEDQDGDGSRMKRYHVLEQR